MAVTYADIITDCIIAYEFYTKELYDYFYWSIGILSFSLIIRSIANIIKKLTFHDATSFNC